MAEEESTNLPPPQRGREVSTTDGAPARTPWAPTELEATLPKIVQARDDATVDAPRAVHAPVRTVLAGSIFTRIRRRLLRIVAVLLAVVVAYYAVSLFQVWNAGRSDSTDPVDAIVVMGAAQFDGRPSPQLASRLDHVIELWPTDIAPLVVVTGGNLPGDRFTEAEASTRYLVERGIPESAILGEGEGSSTYESLANVSEILDARGLDDVLIVSDPYHALRSRLTAEEVGLNAAVSSTDTSVVTGGNAFRRHLQEAGGVAIGRIIGFERLAELVD